MKIEKREYKSESMSIETRNDERPKIIGLSAVFGKMSHDLGGFTEKIAPGAFKKAIGKSDARALYNHDVSKVLGRQSAGTLTIRETRHGLEMEATPPETSYARDVIELIKRGDIDDQSIAFTVEKDTWADIDTDHPTRTIVEVKKIYDVGPVTAGAYQDTTVALRSLDHAREDADTRALPAASDTRGKQADGAGGDGQMTIDDVDKFLSDHKQK